MRATLETESLKSFLVTRGGILSVSIQAILHG